MSEFSTQTMISHFQPKKQYPNAEKEFIAMTKQKRKELVKYFLKLDEKTKKKNKKNGLFIYYLIDFSTFQFLL